MGRAGCDEGVSESRFLTVLSARFGITRVRKMTRVREAQRKNSCHSERSPKPSFARRGERGICCPLLSQRINNIVQKSPARGLDKILAELRKRRMRKTCDAALFRTNESGMCCSTLLSRL